ncbi:MAG: hypothetical protein P1V51_12475 [Deltaproteobacteria bacterium]|nr:hypothetical protein [Deltaproteobacteria bacterium]
MSPGSAPEATPIVDLRVDLRHADPRDLTTLKRLGTLAVVGSWGDPLRGELPRPQEERLEQAASLGSERLEAAGLAGGLCLGIGPGQIPETGRERLLSRLPEFLGRRGVLGLGPVGPGEPGEGASEAVRRRVLLYQLELALSLRLPVLLALPLREQARVIPGVVEAVRESGLPPERVAVLHGSAPSIKILHSLGFFCVLDALAPEAAAALSSRLGAASLGLGSGLGAGPADLLAGRRTLEQARGAGLSPAACRALAGTGAARLFGLSLP